MSSSTGSLPGGWTLSSEEVDQYAGQAGTLMTPPVEWQTTRDVAKAEAKGEALLEAVNRLESVLPQDLLLQYVF